MIPDKENPLSTDILADEVEKGATGADALPNRLNRLSKARRRSAEMSGYCSEHGHVKEADKLAHCGNYLLFKHYFTVDEIRLYAARFCRKHLLCPLCAIRRAAKMVKSYQEKFLTVLEANPHLDPYLVTLTIKNGDDLEACSKHLRKALRKFMQMRRDHSSRPHLYPSIEFSKSMGGFHSIETTNKGNGWHVHVHMVWLCSSEPVQSVLSEEWREITGDSYIVDVRPICMENDGIDGLLEVCKYALKFSDLSLSDNFHAYEVFTRQRLIDSHGLMRGVKIPEGLTDEPLSEDLPFVLLLYRYYEKIGYTFDRKLSPQ